MGSKELQNGTLIFKKLEYEIPTPHPYPSRTNIHHRDQQPTDDEALMKQREMLKLEETEHIADKIMTNDQQFVEMTDSTIVRGQEVQEQQDQDGGKDFDAKLEDNDNKNDSNAALLASQNGYEKPPHELGTKENNDQQ